MKIRTIATVLCATVVSLSLSSCASMLSGSHQTVSVVTPPMKDATCTLSNDKGTWFVNKTPGSVTIHQSFQDMKVQCERKGFAPVETSVSSSVKPIMFGNVIWGLAVVVGAGVDAADGAGFKYPQTISVAMPEKTHR